MDYSYNIICPDHFREKICKLSIFEIDLGRAYSEMTANGERIASIKDSFVNSFHKDTKKLIYRFGRIGSLTFYTCPSMSNSVILVSDNEGKIQEIRYDANSASNNIEKYLVDIILKVDGNM